MSSKQVLWSGGLDSTYLVYKYLQDGHQVDAYYINIGNNKSKAKRELAAIAQLNKLLSKYNFAYKGELSSILINTQNITGHLNLALKQVPLWLLSACFLNGTIGYVMNDCAISYIPEINKIVDALNLIRFEKIIVEFPLIKTSKQDIINNLPREYLQLVTWCESEGSRKSCGKCSPCIRHKGLKNVKRQN